MFVNLSSEYTDYRITDFNRTQSILSFLRHGVFGPLNMTGSRLNNISREHKLIAGDRHTELKHIYNYTMKMQEPEFISSLTLASLDMIKVVESSNKLYKDFP